MSLMPKSVLAVAILSATQAAFATQQGDNLIVEEVIITGGKEAIKTLPGSAHYLSPEELEKFQYTDVQQIVASVPGVYVRSEDGYGLRPNIGIRGVLSERSQKISLMEDGILIAPAAYSAPSAYYFPNAARMHAVEVFKGPVGIQYGPHTVGGAVNLVSTPIPNENQGLLDVAYGTDNYQKIHTWFGGQEGKLGYLVEALRLSADGFKELDTGGDTGFERNDVRLKLAYEINEQHSVRLKLGYADEDSDETYTGLTRADFAANPDRRYFATQKDRMQWDHQQIELSHRFSFGDDSQLVTRIYRNDFSRAWNKLDNNANWQFSLHDILNNPTDPIKDQYYLILTGQRDATLPNEQLEVTNNDRDYYSQGIQFDLDYDLIKGEWDHDIHAGLRIHQDQVERNHTAVRYDVINGQMVLATPRVNTLKNIGKTTAVALYLNDEISYQDWNFNTGVRFEDIQGELTETFPGNSVKESSQQAVLFAFGAYYQLSDSLGVLAGVNQGFSPAAPGSDADPEEGVNLEYGLRYEQDNLQAEVIGFFNDYKQLIVRCRQSDVNCTVGEDFNTGSAETSGVELNLAADFELGEFVVPTKLTYTFTESFFTESFVSPSSQLLNVQKGDSVPYLPEHTLRLETGLQADQWSVNLAANYVSEMRDSASQEPLSQVVHTDAYTTLDLSAKYQVNPSLGLNFKVDNLADETAIVSYRPYGARPNKPRAFIVGATFAF